MLRPEYQQGGAETDCQEQGGMVAPLGDYDKSLLQYSYSLDGKTWENIGEQMLSPYQLKTFQGVRVALYAFNKAGVNGGVADFDDFKVEEPMADRTANLPIGKDHPTL